MNTILARKRPDLYKTRQLLEKKRSGEDQSHGGDDDNARQGDKYHCSTVLSVKCSRAGESKSTHSRRPLIRLAMEDQGHPDPGQIQMMEDHPAGPVLTSCGSRPG